MPRKLKSERICIDCGAIGVAERKRCLSCAKEYNRVRERKRVKIQGRYNYGIAICPICGKEMTLWRRSQGSHATCRVKTVEDYRDVTMVGNCTAGRSITLALGVEIPKGWVVHHLDENPENNVEENLIVVDRKDHNSLHRILQYQKVLLMRNKDFSESRWIDVRKEITSTWLEKLDKNFIVVSKKICEITRA